MQISGPHKAELLLRSAVATLSLGLLAGAPALAADEPVILAEPVAEPLTPFFDTDVSLGLRGAIQVDTDGETRRELLLNPAFTLSQPGRRLSLTIDGDAEIALSDEAAQIQAARISAATGYDIDSLTTLNGSAALEFTQDGPLDLDPDIASAASTLVGTLNGSVDRTAGRFDLQLRGSLERDSYGVEVLDTGLIVDRSVDNVTSASSGLRVGFAATPILTMFTDLSYGRDFYDQPADDIAARLDGADIAVRLGISGNWQERLLAEFSIGLGRHDYFEAPLDPATATLYDASITYRPTATTELSGTLSTSLEPPDSDSDQTRVTYDLGLDFRHQLNRWVVLRASAALTDERGETGETVKRTIGVGLGADYVLNKHLDLSADYSFGSTQEAGEDDQSAHRIAVGLVYSN